MDRTANAQPKAGAHQRIIRAHIAPSCLARAAKRVRRLPAPQIRQPGTKSSQVCVPAGQRKRNGIGQRPPIDIAFPSGCGLPGRVSVWRAGQREWWKPECRRFSPSLVLRDPQPGGRRHSMFGRRLCGSQRAGAREGGKARRGRQVTLARLADERHRRARRHVVRQFVVVRIVQRHADRRGARYDLGDLQAVWAGWSSDRR